MYCAAQFFRRCAAHAWRTRLRLRRVVSWSLCARIPGRRARLAWVVLWMGLAAALPRGAAAESVTVSNAHLLAAQDGAASLYAQFEFELPAVLEEAVSHGIALYFAVDFELYRGRWYWFDKKLVDRSLSYRLTYSPLTRQYRVGRGTLAQPFDTLDAALSVLKRVHGWRVVDAGIIDANTDAKNYRGRLRLRLDTSRLPKPFQLNALTSREWTLASDWYDLSMVRRPHHVDTGAAQR